MPPVGQEFNAATANHVLWHFGQGGYKPGGFVEALLSAFTKADPINRARLGEAFPGLGAALATADLPDGIEALREVAAS